MTGDEQGNLGGPGGTGPGDRGVGGDEFEADPFARFRRGQLRLELDDALGAVEDLRAVVAAEPEARGALLLLARAYFRSAQLRRATETYQRVVELDPTSDEAHIGLARSLERQSRHAEALRHARIAAAMASRPEYDQIVDRLARRVADNAG